MSSKHTLLFALGALALTSTCAVAPGPSGAQQAPGPSVGFARSCARCHSAAETSTALRDSAGRSVAPFDLWRSSMMANASRDPFWRAQVAVEIAATPSRADEIAETCLRCHAPLAERVGLDDHDTGDPLHVLSCDEELGELAADGASCTICHGIVPDGLGTEETWDGRGKLDPERRQFGPHADPFAMPMQRLAGFTPAEGHHVTESALCATCHTLRTEALLANGEPAGGGVLEQAPYLEWRNSAFVDENGERGPRAATCQDCHMPKFDADGAAIETRIARNPGGRDFPMIGPRSPVGRHLLVGGNTLVPALFRDHGAALGTDVPPEAFEATRAAAQEHLERRAARVAVLEAERTKDGLAFTVRVTNRAGHKLPTGHPSRRAWLRVRVADAANADGTTRFMSGATDERGVLIDGEGAPLPSELAGGPEQPHRDAVRAADEVALFQSVLRDADGAPTYLLLRGAGYLRDDRLLPNGWSAAHPDAALTAPVGTDGDADFRGGEDRVRYEIALDGAAADGPLAIEVELCYQTLGARWLAELETFDLPEVRTFTALLETADLRPVVLDRDVVLVPR